MSVPGAPSDNTTLVSVLGLLGEQGYDRDFWVDDDSRLCCRTCGTCAAPDDADMHALRRVEGASDPADMAAVVAARCGACGAQGTAVVRFGPEASAAEGAFLRRVENHRNL